jgi:hypothetical protein
LIVQAILQAPEMQITVFGIYKYISQNYPYYKMSNRDWKKSIRHNLSIKRYFVKIPQHLDDPSQRRNFWTIDPAYEGYNRTKRYPNEEKCGKNHDSNKKKPNANSEHVLSHHQGNYVLYEHNYCHYGENLSLLPCYLCKKKFPTEKQLLIHICSVHQPSVKLNRTEFEKNFRKSKIKPKNPRVTKRPEFWKTSGAYSCTKCKKHFKSMAGFRKHVTAIHNGLMQKYLKEEKISHGSASETETFKEIPDKEKQNDIMNDQVENGEEFSNPTSKTSSTPTSPASTLTNSVTSGN